MVAFLLLMACADSIAYAEAKFILWHSRTAKSKRIFSRPMHSRTAIGKRVLGYAMRRGQG